jgi:hypothetical protein
MDTGEADTAPRVAQLAAAIEATLMVLKRELEDMTNDAA